jgi:GNAT superfamily N-acetyltransferase
MLPLTSREMEPAIRRIKPTEWQLLRELRLRSLLDAPEAFGQTYANASAIENSEWQQNARGAARGDSRTWLVANLNGADVGLVQARRRAPDDCLVFSMWVAPEARRSGVGRLLLDAVADWAQTWGAHRIVLWVVGANEGAHRFYDDVGFRVLSEGPDAESGNTFGAFAMERLIPTPE